LSEGLPPLKTECTVDGLLDPPVMGFDYVWAKATLDNPRVKVFEGFADIASQRRKHE
jgi:hypothetical protein